MELPVDSVAVVGAGAGAGLVMAAKGSITGVVEVLLDEATKGSVVGGAASVEKLANGSAGAAGVVDVVAGGAPMRSKGSCGALSGTAVSS